MKNKTEKNKADDKKKNIPDKIEIFSINDLW